MKHIPNFITLANLFFGCCAIVACLTAYPYFVVGGDEQQYVQIQGTESIYMASVFIFLAAIMDMLDGMVARALKVSSNLGRDLDSLADVVSFGVAPGVIIFQMLWKAYMMEPGALQTPFIVMAPALILPCFAAYRLATFNQTADEQRSYFKGMPTPAAGIAVAFLPLIYHNSYNVLGQYLENRWVLYTIILVLGLLMISRKPFLKWSTGNKGIAGFWPQLIVALVAIVGYFFIGLSSLLIAFIVYIIASFVYKYPQLDNNLSSK